jgi:tetratricopeptide (TPR) repeat protein
MQKVEVLKTLARSDDRRSARMLFDELLAGKFKQPPFVLGTLKAAARLVAPDRLRALLPLLERQATRDYPLKGGQPAPPDAYRDALLRGGIAALSRAGVEAALPSLCDVLLEPRLQYNYEWRYQSALPGWVMRGLREYPALAVNAAVRAALERAEADGRLSRLRPDHLVWLARYAREARHQGRGLYEVGLAFCEVVERLPWEGDVYYEKMRALGGLARYKPAAAAARREAARQRALRFDGVDGYRTPAFLEGRALLYGAVAARDWTGVLQKLGDDPFLLNLAAWYAVFYVPDATAAEQAAEAAVRLSAGLYHPYRDTLAAVRINQNRPREALRLLDQRQILPDERQPGSGWFLYFQARAAMLLGDEKTARQDLERALGVDRRLLPTARKEPAFSGFSDLFRQVEEDYLDTLFAWYG